MKSFTIYDHVLDETDAGDMIDTEYPLIDSSARSAVVMDNLIVGWIRVNNNGYSPISLSFHSKWLVSFNRSLFISSK